MKRTTKRRGTRQRRLFHEQLEDRRLLNADTGWLFGVGADLDAGVSPDEIVVDAAGNTYVSGLV